MDSVKFQLLLFFGRPKMLRVCIALMSVAMLVAGGSSDKKSGGLMVSPTDDRVSVEIYYESLCKSCKNFFVDSLKKTIQVRNIHLIANFKLIPFGNANLDKFGQDYDFTCQNGENECIGNIIHQCALDRFPKELSLPFIVCLEESDKNWSIDGSKCASQNGIDWKTIKSCTNSLEGRERLFYSGLTTKYVRPRSVPSVYINGEDNAERKSEVLHNLLKVICEDYFGKVELPECKIHKEAVEVEEHEGF